MGARGRVVEKGVHVADEAQWQLIEGRPIGCGRPPINLIGHLCS